MLREAGALLLDNADDRSQKSSRSPSASSNSRGPSSSASGIA